MKQIRQRRTKRKTINSVSCVNSNFYYPSFPDLIGESSLFYRIWIVRSSRTMTKTEEKMIKIGVAGAAGKMGSRIAALSREYEGLLLTGVFERKGHKDIGKDIGTLTGTGELGILLSSGIEEIIDKVDLIIDFTSTESTKENLKIASGKGKAMVIGTTGFSREDLKEIEVPDKNNPLRFGLEYESRSQSSAESASGYSQGPW